jgi:acetylornithine deacetylase/succinyl-diaminopimelate desuccinylase family protein
MNATRGIDQARLVARLMRLCAADTQNPPGREAAVALPLAEELAGFGFAVALPEVFPGRPNLIATLANGGGPRFAFNTHADVVQAGAGWTTPPFQPVIRDGRLFARGACDAKGSMAAMVEACAALAADRAAWSGTLIAAFVVDEEVASAGARAYAATRPGLDLAVVGEPTGNAVYIAHKGSLRPVVRIHGRTAHSATPQLGRNAILDAARLLLLLERLGAEIAARPGHPLLGGASLTVTRASAGIADNIVPDSCDLLLDRRLLPGETEDAAVAEIEALFAAAGVVAEIVARKPTTGGPVALSPDHPLVRTALAIAGRHGADGAAPRGFPGACDLVHMAAAGAAGVILGPGSLAVAHQPDEHVPLAELLAAASIYRELALAMMPA